MAALPTVDVSLLAGLPGAPFTQATVDAALDSLRAMAGWHIGPEITETVTLDSSGGRVLLLPTMLLSSVTDVFDMTGTDPVALTGWRKSKNGMLSRDAGWPCGFEAVKVTMVHGYTEFPAALLPTLADYSSRRVAQESLGSRSVSYAIGADSRFDSALARFTLPGRP